jgi:hypothetical protein
VFEALAMTFTKLLAAMALASLATACGSVPPPSDKLVQAESAARSAKEIGAERDPKAALHLKLAQEQIEAARAQMQDEENKRAAATLAKATADAELSLQLAREANEVREAEKAKDHLKAVKAGR